MPEYYQIRHAQSADEVLIELRKFVDYVKSGPVITLLPSTLQEISSRDATDVAKWQEQIERVLQDTPSIGATVLFWLNLLDELFKGARHRLDELLRASHAGR
jgi:hypothetical protein